MDQMYLQYRSKVQRNKNDNKLVAIYHLIVPQDYDEAEELESQVHSWWVETQSRMHKALSHIRLNVVL